MEGTATDATRNFFLTNANEEGMASRRLGGVEYSHGTIAGSHDLAISKADPLAVVLFQELFADGPVVGLVFATKGMKMPGDLRGQLVGDGSHGNIT